MLKKQTNAPFIAAAFLIVIAFASIWMPWMNIKVSVYGSSIEETVDFTDILETDEEYTGYSTKLDDYNSGMSDIISKKDYDDILNTYHTMKYAGIAGYILLLLTAVCAVINKKAMTAASILASLAFAAAMVGDILYCSKTQSFMEDLSNELVGSLLSIDYEFTISYGNVLPLAASIILAVISFNILKQDASQDDLYY